MFGDPLMMLALSGGQYVTETFTSTTNWTAPTGVTNIVSMSGHGANGTSDSTAPAGYPVVTIDYRNTGSNVGNIRWDAVQSAAPSVASDLNDGAASFTAYSIIVYPDETNEVFSFQQTIANAVPGSAYSYTAGGWQTSGHISSSGQSFVGYVAQIDGQAGAAANALGKGFTGGAAGGGVAPTTSYTNVAVTPGQTYTFTIPAGGSISISYYK